ncbi:cytochrome c biogenesis heme-transporting ATPase CcmA [Atlantibacter hermannii]|uniref:cytochrome c biogenesis heme-transporting ATPase CcmA n=1 Tax=Atlantibacter hermannii TaxID=565 RepID=UPI001C7002B1|nr:cytochrome c biogenesis heme-transporting ATPase CcmA [Atlantibacter hermannii]MBW9430899.1 cytochrome c biogenesis heme-transporting ATPase CcmA [Atlantibacter hermannii]
MLDVLNLACVRDERVLFRGLSFTLNPGEIFQIAGVNGAGKTSLLRILSGLATPETGEVKWQGEAIQRARDSFHSRLLWLGHQPGIKAVLTSDENLRFFHADAAMKSRWDALAAIGLLGYEDVPVGQLSAGQQRRVALARLWLSTAKLWILDEPFTALDPAGIETLTCRLEAHAALGGSVLLTTHQPLRPVDCAFRKLMLPAGGVS